MIKAGIIRCMQTEDVCSGKSDFAAAENGTCAFKEFGPVQVIGFVSCGGCPGKKAVYRARQMADSGAKVIFLASCIKIGSPIGFPCPHFQIMKDSIQKKIGENVTLVDMTH